MIHHIKKIDGALPCSVCLKRRAQTQSSIFISVKESDFILILPESSWDQEVSCTQEKWLGIHTSEETQTVLLGGVNPKPPILVLKQNTNYWSGEEHFLVSRWFFCCPLGMFGQCEGQGWSWHSFTMCCAHGAQLVTPCTSCQSLHAHRSSSPTAPENWSTQDIVFKIPAPYSSIHPSILFLPPLYGCHFSLGFYL